MRFVGEKWWSLGVRIWKGDGEVIVGEKDGGREESIFASMSFPDTHRD